MKRYIVSAFAVLAASCCAAGIPAAAQDKFTVSGKLDFVTDYIWRGMDQNSAFSAQPGIGLSYKGLTLSAWGSRSLTNWSETSPKGPQEFDIALSYSIKGFTLTVTDYWWAGLGAGYGDYSGAHFFEGMASFCFSETCNLPLTISWATMFAGADKGDDGRLRASTYISASYDIACPYGITLTPSVGFTPWKGLYSHRTNVTDISLKASKSLKVTDGFSIPLFVQCIAAPWLGQNGNNGGNDKVFLVAGFSLGF